MRYLKLHLNGWFNRRLQLWLLRQQPAQNPLALHHRFMFVLPTRFGMALLALVVLLYVLGTNYQNNLIMLLSYLLLVLWLSCILLVYLNLHRWQLSTVAELDCVANESVTVPVLLKAPTTSSPAASSTSEAANNIPLGLQARWHQLSSQWQNWLQPQLQLTLCPPKRGRYPLPRLAVQSVYPFGLMRCWAYLQLDCTLWVYPKPAEHPQLPTKHLQQGAPDEWAGLKLWQSGASMRQIDWKRYARDNQLRVHVYQTQQRSGELWLTMNPALPDLESQLADLAAQVLLADEHQQIFGVRLGHQVIAPGSGHLHLQTVMRALAIC